MSGIPEGARIRNVSSREWCKWCDDDGFVVVKLRPAAVPGEHFDENGPCPMCERGFAVEFPATERGGPWGKDGYWQGRDPIDLPEHTKGRPLGAVENARRMRELIGAVRPVERQPATKETAGGLFG